MDIDDVNDSAAFSIITELYKAKEISKVEMEFLKRKYVRLHTTLLDLKDKEVASTKKLKDINANLLNDKILFEKCKIEEHDKLQLFQLKEKEKQNLHKDFESIEKEEMMAKFELSELEKLHLELQSQLDTIQNQNNSLVGPVLNDYKTQISNLNNQLIAADEKFVSESNNKLILTEKLDSLHKTLEDKSEQQINKLESLKSSENEPARLGRQVESIEKALQAMKDNYSQLENNKRNLENNIENQKIAMTESENLRKNLLEKLDKKRQTIRQRELDVHNVQSNLDRANLEEHELITRKIELNGDKREIENDIRHLSDQNNLLKKEYENSKRQLKKKRAIADSIYKLIPELEDQLKEKEKELDLQRDVKDRLLKTASKMKDEIDGYLAQCLIQEGLELDKKKELEESIEEIEKLEAEIMNWVAEGRRQSKLLSLLTAQRDVKGRETSRILQKERDAKQHVKVKEMIILDSTKRCNEISNRLKEFSALYEVVKNERNKYVNLIQSSAQSFAEMKEKIRILSNEVEILGNESSAKDVALTKERTSHNQSQRQRDGLRQDMNRLLADYKVKQSVIEQQIQEIDKLNMVITSIENEMIGIKKLYEKAIEDRNKTGVQLIDKNDDLCILYEKVNQQSEINRTGENELLKREEELRMITIQTDELKRQYFVAQKRLPSISVNEAKISLLEKLLSEELDKTENLSLKLEDPKNLDRWRPLDGEDVDIEQILAKEKVLSTRLDYIRESLLEKELILEEITSLSDKLKTQALANRDAAKYLADQLNDMQNKTRTITKKIMASVSELSMYQATTLRLQQEKFTRTKELESATAKLNSGEAPYDEAVKELEFILSKMKGEDKYQYVTDKNPLPNTVNGVQTSAMPRPTAYIPDEIGLSKPYGKLAPFKPTEIGSTMRHTSNPKISDIEF